MIPKNAVHTREQDFLQHIAEVKSQAVLLYDTEAVERGLQKMASCIAHELGEANPVCLTVMNGGMIPAAGLLRYLQFPLTMDYVHATRYQGQTAGGREVVFRAKPRTELLQRTVLVIDDILDGGVTLAQIVDFCKQAGAKRVWTAVLLEKNITRVPEAIQHADFVGLFVGDDYVFGYGMDYREYLRNMPGVYAVNRVSGEDTYET